MNLLQAHHVSSSPSVSGGSRENRIPLIAELAPYDNMEVNWPHVANYFQVPGSRLTEIVNNLLERDGRYNIYDLILAMARHDIGGNTYVAQLLQCRFTAGYLPEHAKQTSHCYVMGRHYDFSHMPASNTPVFDASQSASQGNNLGNRSLRVLPTAACLRQNRYAPYGRPSSYSACSYDGSSALGSYNTMGALSTGPSASVGQSSQSIFFPYLCPEELLEEPFNVFYKTTLDPPTGMRADFEAPQEAPILGYNSSYVPVSQMHRGASGYAPSLEMGLTEGAMVSMGAALIPLPQATSVMPSNGKRTDVVYGVGGDPWIPQENPRLEGVSHTPPSLHPTTNVVYSNKTTSPVIISSASTYFLRSQETSMVNYARYGSVPQATSSVLNNTPMRPQQIEPKSVKHLMPYKTRIYCNAVLMSLEPTLWRTIAEQFMQKEEIDQLSKMHPDMEEEKRLRMIMRKVCTKLCFNMVMTKERDIIQVLEKARLKSDDEDIHDFNHCIKLIYSVEKINKERGQQALIQAPSVSQKRSMPTGSKRSKNNELSLSVNNLDSQTRQACYFLLRDANLSTCSFIAQQFMDPVKRVEIYNLDNKSEDDQIVRRRINTVLFRLCYDLPTLSHIIQVLEASKRVSGTKDEDLQKVQRVIDQLKQKKKNKDLIASLDAFSDQSLATVGVRLQ